MKKAEPKRIEAAILERHMEVAQDVKKAFAYDKSDGTWGWHDRDEPEAIHGGFPSFWACLCDAVAPYTGDEWQE